MAQDLKIKFTGFHGSTVSGINELTPSKRGAFGSGIYFADTIDTAEQYGENIIEAELTLGNPWIVSADWESPATSDYDLDSPSVDAVLSLPGGESFIYTARSTDGLYDENLTNVIKELGYDSIIATYPDGSKEYISFNPAQIKTVNRHTIDDSLRP